MTDKQALERLIFELDDVARCDRTWFAWRRLKRLKRAVSRASDLAMKANVSALYDAVGKEGVLEWPC